MPCIHTISLIISSALSSPSLLLHLLSSFPASACPSIVVGLSLTSPSLSRHSPADGRSHKACCVRACCLAFSSPQPLLQPVTLTMTRRNKRKKKDTKRSEVWSSYLQMYTSAAILKCPSWAHSRRGWECQPTSFSVKWRLFLQPDIRLMNVRFNWLYCMGLWDLATDC